MKSRKESNGTIISPNYPHPYPLGVRCLYFIDGLVNIQNLEKVRLDFNELSIPVLNPNRRRYVQWIYLTFVYKILLKYSIFERKQDKQAIL